MDPLTGVARGDVRFTPHSRPISGPVLMSANDPKRTFDIHELRPGWAFPSQPILNFKSDAVRFCGGHPIEG